MKLDISDFDLLYWIDVKNNSEKKKKSHTLTYKSSFKKCRNLKFLDKDNKLIFGYSHMWWWRSF